MHYPKIKFYLISKNVQENNTKEALNWAKIDSEFNKQLRESGTIY